MIQKLLNISERVNIAIHALAYIGAAGKNASVKKMAEDLQVSETYLAKVLQPLVKEIGRASCRERVCLYV